MIVDEPKHAAMNAAAAGPGVSHSGAPSGLSESASVSPARHRGLRMIGLLAATLLLPLTASADALSPRELPRAIAHDFKSLVTTRQNLAFALAGAGAAWAGSTADDRIVESRFNSEVREETTLDHVFEAGDHLGGVTQIAGACATYGLGLLSHQPEVQALGSDLVRAQFVNGVLTVGLKKAVGRERPDHSNRASFPSGHASGTFATATVLHRRYGPRTGIPAFLLAGYVAGSRLNESQHFLSDVLAGAALGIIVGHTITRDHEDGRLGIYPTVSPHGAGIRFVYRPIARAPSSGAHVAMLR